MDYRITCICGHSFQVPEEKLKERIHCPACGQPLSAVPESGNGAIMTPPPGAPVATPTASAEPVPTALAAAEATKRCPYCGEVILAIARKCRHCGEFLDRSLQPDSTPSTTDPAAAADVPPVYALAVSQWDNFWRFLILLTIVLALSLVLALIPSLRDYAQVGIPGALVLAGFVAWYFYLSAKSTRCFIRPTRIDTESGILSKDLNSLELFRVTDTELKQGLIERILGIGTIKLRTVDSTSEPELVLYQIPRAREVLKYIQIQIPIAARQRGAVYMEK